MTTSDLKSPGTQSAGGANPRGDAGYASPAEIPPSATGSIHGAGRVGRNRPVLFSFSSLPEWFTSREARR